MRLSAEQKEMIRSILRRLGHRQKALANEMGYATGNLSEFLNRDKEKGVETETWESLLKALEKLKIGRGEKLAKDPNLERDIAAVHTWPVVDVATTTAALVNSASVVSGGRLYSPPGPMPLDADNYIPRRADGVIREIIDYPHSRSVIVQGAIGSGRTSWLRRLEEAAKKSGATVVFLDDGFLAATDSSDLIRAAVARISSALHPPALETMDGEGGDPRAVAAEVIAALRGITGGTSLYLLVDDAESWPESQERFKAFSEFVSQLQMTLIANTDFPHKLVIASALTPTLWPTTVGSRMASQSAIANLSFHTDQQIQELTVHYHLEVETARKVKRYTGGHPCHTQLLLWACKNGDTVEDVIQRAKLLDPGDGWDGVDIRLKSVLKRVANDAGIDLRGLLTKAVALISGSTSTSTPLKDDEYAVLRSVGALDGPKRQPVINLFFIDLASHWLEEEAV